MRVSFVPAAARQAGRGFVLSGVLILLLSASLASLALGTATVSPGALMDLLTGQPPTSETLLVQTLRGPRTLLGLLAGMGLGASGALMQSLTRSPLADPGLLGVNAGAAALMVTGIALFGLSSIEWRLVLAFFGAMGAMLLVLGMGGGSSGRSSAPTSLLLAGVALTAALGGLTTIVMLSDPEIFDEMRQWSAGSLVTIGYDVPLAILGPIVLGIGLASYAGPTLNALALGPENAVGLGVEIVKVRILILVSIALLCGAATAAVGPIAFVGLMVPHFIRMLVGPDEQRVLILSTLSAPSLLLLSDVAGRLILRPAELQVGIVVAFLGAPVLIGLARGRLNR